MKTFDQTTILNRNEKKQKALNGMVNFKCENIDRMVALNNHSFPLGLVSVMRACALRYRRDWLHLVV